MKGLAGAYCFCFVNFVCRHHSVLHKQPLNKTVEWSCYEQVNKTKRGWAGHQSKKSTIYQRIKEGRFPVAVRLGSRSVAWKSEEIQEWKESRPRVKSWF